MHLCFTLSMPNCNSWNGKWSGEGKLYARIFKFDSRRKESLKKAETLLTTGSYYYNFGDGWGASIVVQLVTAAEARKIKKKSAGFCNYDWMIASILAHGDIYNSLQIKELLKNQQQSIEADSLQ